jgi:hypothetical protein
MGYARLWLVTSGWALLLQTTLQCACIRVRVKGKPCNQTGVQGRSFRAAGLLCAGTEPGKLGPGSLKVMAE